MEQKSRKILKALSAGHSCERILAEDCSVTYHDIFRVVTEAPTSFWRKRSTGIVEHSFPVGTDCDAMPAKHSAD